MFKGHARTAKGKKMINPFDDSQWKTITVTVHKDQMDELNVMGEESFTSVGDLVLCAIEKYIKECKPKKLKVYRHTDPGHGWYAVNIKLLTRLGIEQGISSCSYRRGSTVYLEEDSDAPKFFRAYLRSMGCDPEKQTNIRKLMDRYFDFKISYKEKSPVRYFSSYKAPVSIHAVKASWEKIAEEKKKTCPYPGCDSPYTKRPPCALCYE